MEWSRAHGFDTVLVANRGEIAVRVIRTLRLLGIRAAAIYSDADSGARHITEADTAIWVGPAPATDSYLSIERILNAAAVSGAQAIHPGYGFLAESAAFASACAEAGFVFIGPPPSAIETMGDKIRAKQTAREAGVPVTPGRGEPGMSDEDLARVAREVGLPVLLKPSAGGGGKGMRTIHDEASSRTQIAAARREARAAFGDDTLLVERLVTQPRHIEVQVLADTHGVVVHLGERECSLQRRHQKIIEEAPSALLNDVTRRRIGAAAVDVARAVGYVGAGTVEFLVSADRPDEFFFMEMNTRLQVEHPATELVTAIDGGRGIDLVEWQLRIATGEPLPFQQRNLWLDGHAVEARVYAEAPEQGFLPTGGTVLALSEPENVDCRVDSGIAAGDWVGSDYDPLLAKIIAWGPTRAEALRRLDSALANTAIVGLGTNVAFLRALLNHSDVQAGQLDTGLVSRDLELLVNNDPPPDHVYVAAALECLIAAEPTGPVVDPWDVPGGWRIGEPAWSIWRFASGGTCEEVWVRGRADQAEVLLSGQTSADTARATTEKDTLELTYCGQTRRYLRARADNTTWLARHGQTWKLTEHQLLTSQRDQTSVFDGNVTSPMPGTVLSADLAVGQRVLAGETLFVVEAMKMEHTVRAPITGAVTAIHVHKGQSVRLGQPLAALNADQSQET